MNPFTVYSKLKKAPESNNKFSQYSGVVAGKIPSKLSFRQRRDSYRQLSKSKRERDTEQEDNSDSLALATQLSGGSTLKRTMQKIQNSSKNDSIEKEGGAEPLALSNSSKFLTKNIHKSASVEVLASEPTK